MKQRIIEHWLLKPSQYDLKSITRSQIQQAWARILFSFACAAYLTLHAVFFAEFKVHILLILSAYLIYNSLTLIMIQRVPLSAFRLLFAPFFDTFVICYAMMIDGGNASGMFYILFIIIIGNSFRFGNPLMIYTQALSIAGLAIITAFLSMQMQVPPDSTLLLWQFSGLLAIPFYVYLIRRKSEDLLRVAHENLEHTVEERTRQLSQINDRLHHEIAEKAEAIDKMEQAEMKYQHAQKMEAIGTLVGGIAHDFNNMLSGITANLFLIQRQISNADAIKRLEKIGDLTMHAAEIIKQLMTFARKDDVQLKRFDLSVFFKKALELACVSIPEHIDCDVILPEEKLFVEGDATQIQQILMNLLNNARDALKGCEHPSIRVSLHRFSADEAFLKKHHEAESAEYAVFSVQDNGSGISHEKIDKIFEPFYTTKEAGAGTGLGLSMIYGAVQAHGGIIDVQSRVGDGTGISIYLPLSDQDAYAKKSNDDRRVVNGHGETILLVDDDEHLLESNKALLLTLGYHVHTASNGIEAISCYRSLQHQIDLVIMDIVMPQLGGVAAAEKIRKLNSKAKIILITGYDKDNELTSELTTQWDQVLEKPFVVEELSRVIQQRLQG